MNPQLVAAERRFEVRRAAERWHEAGAIPPEVRDRINAAYADDRFRVGPVFRTLLFFFTLIASWALFGFFLTVTNFAFENAQEIGTVCLLLGGLLLGLGELLRSQRFRFARAGVEEAGTLLGFAWLVAAVCYWISANAPDGSRSFPVWTFLVLLTAGSGFLIWRTGLPVLGALGACGALGLLARLPAGRALWVLAGFALGAWLLRLAASPQLAPSQRRAGLFAVATLLTGAYVAIHLGSLDVGLVEILGGRATLGTQRTVSPLGRQVSIVAMALYPLAILAWAFGRRHRLLLWLGLGSAIASLVTLRVYVQLAPLWVVLTVSGALLIALALAARRYLHHGLDHERRGWTAEPLFESEQARALLEAALSVTTLAPEARPPDAPKPFEGQGGDFGGGGASGTF